MNGGARRAPSSGAIIENCKLEDRHDLKKALTVLGEKPSGDFTQSLRSRVNAGAVLY
jgi:hypothetical protein